VEPLSPMTQIQHENDNLRREVEQLIKALEQANEKSIRNVVQLQTELSDMKFNSDNLLKEPTKFSYYTGVTPTKFSYYTGVTPNVFMWLVSILSVVELTVTSVSLALFDNPVNRLNLFKYGLKTETR